MPADWRRFSVFSTALSLLLAGRRKARSLPFIDARRPQSVSLSSIADAMLNRAVKGYQPPPPKGASERAAAAPSPNHPTQKINDILKSSQKSAQNSIGGFTNFTNARSSFTRLSPQSKIAPLQKASGPRKRTSAEMNGFAATLSKATSFEDTSNTIDLTADEDKVPGEPPQVVADFHFDPDDFDDDSELDLDVEYPQALPALISPRQPLQTLTANRAQNAPSISQSKQPAPEQFAAPQSSAQTWSSSPLAHKLTPPRAANRQFGHVVHPATVDASLQQSSGASIDDNPRPAKRRTVPWSKSREADAEVDGKKALPFTRTGFSGKIDSTPAQKSKSMPWDTTASAIKEQQKAFKLQKKMARDDASALEDVQDIVKSTSRSRPAPIFLSEEQKKVLELVINKKKSVFFTGSAGTGKSVLMRSIIADLRKTYARESDRVAVTASTGLAACNIGGVTLHSFGGIGLGKEAVPELVKKIRRNPKAKTRWLRTKVLIIDEISMVDGDLFDKLEGIARNIRANGRPFGGIQLVITGDFFQLPPVPDYGQQRKVKFAFDASTWGTAIDHTIGLTEVFRQKDPVFANMLNEMRLGKITDETVKAFRRLERPVDNSDSLEATELFPTRNEVENSNAYKMRSLQGKSYTFKAVDTGTERDEARRDKLLSNCMAPPVLELKKGAQVMLIKNIDENLVNGSLGKVIAFMNEKTFEIYDENPELLDAPGAVEDGGDSNPRADAKSRLKAFKMDGGLIGDTAREYPLVRFSIADGTSRDLLCQPEEWKIELPNGEVQAQRRQLPLILAWALSIHKAQGQTLERVTVDLRRAFENGQAYVALSRATCQEGLQVKNFNKKAVMAHPRVTEFYESLYSVNAAMRHPKIAQSVGMSKSRNAEKDSIPPEFEDMDHGFDMDDEEAMMAFG